MSLLLIAIAASNAVVAVLVGCSSSFCIMPSVDAATPSVGVAVSGVVGLCCCWCNVAVSVGVVALSDGVAILFSVVVDAHALIFLKTRF